MNRKEVNGVPVLSHLRRSFTPLKAPNGMHSTFIRLIFLWPWLLSHSYPDMIMNSRLKYALFCFSSTASELISRRGVFSRRYYGSVEQVSYFFVSNGTKHSLALNHIISFSLQRSSWIVNGIYPECTNI